MAQSFVSVNREGWWLSNLSCAFTYHSSTFKPQQRVLKTFADSVCLCLGDGVSVAMEFTGKSVYKFSFT